MNDSKQVDRAARLKAMLRKKKGKVTQSLPELKVAKLVEVGQNIYGLRLPNFSVLEHVNVWLLRDNQRWTIVDTGAAVAPVREILTDILSSLPGGGKVEEIIITHIHDDHFGNAGWLQEQTGAQVWMSELEWGFVQAAKNVSRQDFEELWYTFFARAGLNREAVRDHGLHRLDYLDAYPLPKDVAVLKDQSKIKAGGRTWKVRLDAGHTAAHAMLFDQAEEFVLAADHGLAEYPIGLGPDPTSPTHDPVPGFLDALDALEECAPEALILPGHGGVWKDGPKFAKQTRRRLMTRQNSMIPAFKEWTGAATWCANLLQRATSSHQKYLILADAIGHVNHLEASGGLRSTIDEENDRVVLFKSNT